MKWSSVSLLAGALAVVLTGCNSQGTPGGPKGSNAGSKPMVGQGDDTFTLDVPNLSTKIKQGDTQTIAIAPRRGKNFDQDVSLKFDGLPKGVTLDPGTPTIKHGDKDTSIKIVAADDAALGDFTVKVTGHPGKGTDAVNEFKITVEKK